jgi:hypothetical protein
MDPRELRSVSVHFRLDAKSYDRTLQQAAADRLPLADWIRRLIDKACRQGVTRSDRPQ